MKNLTTFISVTLIAFAIGSAATYYFVNDSKTATLSSLERSKDATIAELTTKLTQESAPISRPYSLEAIDTSTWKTHTNTTLGYTFKYPTTWTLLEGESYGPSTTGGGVSLMPTAYYQTWKDMPKTKDGTPPPLSIGCAKTSESFKDSIEASIKNGTGRSAKSYTLQSGTPTDYYVSTPLWDIQNFYTSKNDTQCALMVLTTDASPLEKTDDATGMQIIESFSFTD